MAGPPLTLCGPHMASLLSTAPSRPVGVLGLTAGRETQGHRFESRLNPIMIREADSYAQQLESEGAVIASFAERHAEIVRRLDTAVAEKDLKRVDDIVLLNEVAGLVENPNVLMGEFESEFLDVPQECLILTMKANQKYFPLLDLNGKLSNKFLIVSNVRPADASQIIAGNERVLRSRLADAKFFFDQDRKKTLASRVEALREVVYHHKLGTQADRVERIWAIAQTIGLRIGRQRACGPGGRSGDAVQGGFAHRHGGRVSASLPGHHGTLLRQARWVGRGCGSMRLKIITSPGLQAMSCRVIGWEFA